MLLISDPSTDKAAAAMDVHIGHMSDPAKLPGLAHFCEHMLFLGGISKTYYKKQKIRFDFVGTKEFSDENEYSKYLSQHGGSFNAFTSSDHTNYYFDVSPDNLSGALDRFTDIKVAFKVGFQLQVLSIFPLAPIHGICH